jgi:hypothetical protein
MSPNLAETASSVAAAETPAMQSLDEPGRSSIYRQSQSMPISPQDYYDDGNDNEEDEEYIELEKDMALRLGNGGRIGVLDVRLVGKELHVSVEDAFLVVEACQRPEEPVDDTDAASAAGSEHEEGSKGKEPAVEKKKVATSKKAAKDMSEGERVLDKSIIASALSAIPHLFLRDCRVRLVIRKCDVCQEADTEMSESDSVVDLGIELLSVTSGEDFLAHVRADEDAAENGAFNDEAYQSQTSFASYDEGSNNEFIVKRIRTGRGPEGGIWLNIYPPGKRNRETAGLKGAQVDQSPDDTKHQWARERWMTDTEFCFFRCSGVDIRSRIFVGKQEETVDEYFFYDEFAVDSMLIGVDYVGQAPSLPPLSQGADADALEAMQSMEDGANTYETDTNGIQSVKVDSVFHKIARGLMPTSCQGDHLPCHTCSACWADNDGKFPKDLNHPLDSSIPLAGVVLNISLNDPLTINVDRSSLEVIGQLVSLFLKETADSTLEVSDEEEVEGDVGSSVHGGRLCMPAARRKASSKKTLTNDAFPEYMQPENIEVIGLHLATIVVRIHVMRSDGSYDKGLSFCYWEMQTRCVTLDVQKLTSEKNVQDVRLDVAEFATVEYKGVKHRQIITLGLPQPEPSSSDSSASPVRQSDLMSSSTHWPSTAYTLLGIPPPIETLHYESRERHALQIRYIDVSGSSVEEVRSNLNMRLGAASIDMPWKTKSDIYDVISETNTSLFGAPPTPSEKGQTSELARVSNTSPSRKQEASPKSSIMKCKIRIDGGRVNIHPVINLCLPPSTFFAEKSSSYGLFIETMLQRLEFAYGERAVVAKQNKRGGLSLFAGLPEAVRLRVLLFVNDLGPLETALGVKHESNALLRFRSVNRGIVKVAKQSKPRRKKGKSRMTSSQREEVLAELLSMDDSALQELWALHKSHTKKTNSTSKR